MAPEAPNQTTNPVDLLIIGGGINGAGIARDAQGRGLSVHLVEQNDFASATSSASSKLIHGGLRYLEYYEFRLVREALKERDVLLRIAPNLVTPMRFILPHRSHLRPSWMIRSGLFLYDTLAGRSVLERSKQLSLKGDPRTNPALTKGFIYSDCWVDDARLVIHNLLDAQKLGATIENYTKCVSAKFQNGLWTATLESNPPNAQTKEAQQKTIQAKVLINATGPWAQTFLEQKLERKSSHRVRHIKGSHLIVPRQFSGSESFILQNEDKRIVFVIPYLDDFMIIGTTDKEYTGDLSQVKIDDEETQYLLDVYNQHFQKTLTKDDIISDYSGVRPLCDDESDDPSAITRDYTLVFEGQEATQENAPQSKGPILNIFGGKLTTYRKLAEASLKELESVFPNMAPAWTQTKALPGGEIPPQQLATQLASQYPWLPQSLIKRWCYSYGSLALKIVEGAQSLEQLGTCFGNDFYAKEVAYLQSNEWANTAKDVLFRRSKLGLVLAEQAQNKISSALDE